MQQELVERMQPGQKYTFQQMRNMLNGKLVYSSGYLQDFEVKRVIGVLVQKGVCEVTLDKKQKYVRMIAR
jgi:hypothetical protein